MRYNQLEVAVRSDGMGSVGRWTSDVMRLTRYSGAARALRWVTISHTQTPPNNDFAVGVFTNICEALQVDRCHRSGTYYHVPRRGNKYGRHFKKIPYGPILNLVKQKQHHEKTTTLNPSLKKFRSEQPNIAVVLKGSFWY